MKYLIPFFLALSVFADTQLVNTRMLTNSIATNNTAINAAGVNYSVDTIADLISLQPKNLNNSASLTKLSVHVRGYYMPNGTGGGLFTLTPTTQLPVDINYTNYGTMFAVSGMPTYRWIRADRSKLTMYDFGALCNGVTADDNYVQDALIQAPEVAFPVNTTTIVNSTMVIPSNRLLHIYGTVSGSGSFYIYGNCKIDGGGTVNFTTGAQNSQLATYSGNVQISNVKFVGSQGKYGILVSKDAALDSLIVRDCYFDSLSYGLLREAYTTNVANLSKYVKVMRFYDNYITNTYASGIDWEPNLADGMVEISRNRVSNNHFYYNGSNGFGGFAIAVAGWNYDQFSSTNALRKTTISDNIIDTTRVGIHVEYSGDTAITGNTIYDVLASQLTYSTNTLPTIMQTVGIDTYGIRKLNVSGNTISSIVSTNGGSYGIYIGLGAGGGYFTTESDRVSVTANYVQGGAIALNMMAPTNSNYPQNFLPVAITVKGNTIYDGQLLTYGRGQFSITDNFIRGPWGVDALVVAATDAYAPYLSGEYLSYMNFANNTAINPYGTPSATIPSSGSFTGGLNRGNLTISGANNNFSLSSSAFPTKVIGRVVATTEGTGVPWGVMFNAGDIIIDTQQKPPQLIYVTGTGSRYSASDTLQTLASTNKAKGWVATTGGTWIKTNYAMHNAGQLVRIGDGSGGYVNGIVKNVFNDPVTGYDICVIASTTTGAIIDFTGVTCQNIEAYPVVTYNEASKASGTLTYGSVVVSAGSVYSTTQSVPSAAVGDYVKISTDQTWENVIFSGYVSSANTVTILAYNPNGTSRTLTNTVTINAEKMTLNR